MAMAAAYVMRANSLDNSQRIRCRVRTTCEPRKADGTCICYAHMCGTCLMVAAYIMHATGHDNGLRFMKEFNPSLSLARLMARAFVMHACVLHVRQGQHM